MLDPQIQWKILQSLYRKWKEFSLLFSVYDLGIEGVDDKNLVLNVKYLVDKGFIGRPQTMRFITQITEFGIDIIEDKRISDDIQIRKKILQVLTDEFERDPHNLVMKSQLIKITSYSEVEIQRNVWYLGKKYYVNVSWYSGGDFAVKVTSRGIDALKEPTALEKELKVMSYAYSMLYELENNLRIFIEKKLRSEYGEMWWEHGVTQKDIRDNVEKTPERDPNISLINYTNFGYLRRIIINNWHVFKETFTTQTIVGRLEELEPLRNTIAHCRSLTDDNLKKLELFFKEINVLISPNLLIKNNMKKG